MTSLALIKKAMEYLVNAIGFARPHFQEMCRTSQICILRMHTAKWMCSLFLDSCLLEVAYLKKVQTSHNGKQQVSDVK